MVIVAIQEGLLDGNGEAISWPKIQGILQLGFPRRLEVLVRIRMKCKVDPATGCWVYEGPTSGNGRGGGYGRFSFEGVTASVHRTTYAIVYGPIPGKKQIDHACNNRRCCNPEHLKMMTHKANQKLRDERRKTNASD